MAQVLQTYWQSAHFALLLPRAGRLHTQIDARINDLFSAQNRQILRAPVIYYSLKYDITNQASVVVMTNR